MNRISTGKNGEDLAVRHLEGQGYRIVQRNFRLRIGEIDIIARDGDCLVFVEVKSRRSNRYGSPFEAVTPHKQWQISRVAQAFMEGANYGEVAVRFDVVAVFLDRSPVGVELIKNAFEYNG